MHLHEQYCNNITKPALLSKEDIQRYIKDIPQWHADITKKNISCSYSFENYYQTLLFVNTIADIAHKENHHPTINFNYNSCKVIYSTHSIAGISLFDFICAAKIQRVYDQSEIDI